jgi:protein phosphatase inhibitor 2
VTIDIPNLDLSWRYTPSSNPSSPGLPSPTDADTSGPSSRRTSLSSVGRPPSVSGRPGSSNSSRSTSFNLPNEARREIRADKRQAGEEVELDEEMDEESQLLILFLMKDYL